MGRYISTFIGIGREEWEPPPTSWEITNNYYTITLQLSLSNIVQSKGRKKVRRTDKIVYSSLSNITKVGLDISILLLLENWCHTNDIIFQKILKRKGNEREGRKGGLRRSRREKELEGRTEKGRRIEEKFVKEIEGRRGRRKKEMDGRKGKEGGRMGKKEKEWERS
jgi:hypothetical protein